jgi:hypothetical protein
VKSIPVNDLWVLISAQYNIMFCVHSEMLVLLPAFHFSCLLPHFAL